MNTDSIGSEPDSNHIDPPGTGTPCQRPDLPPFRVVERVDGIRAPIVVEHGRLHLDGDALPSVLGENVDLTSTDPHVAFDDVKPAANEKLRSDPLSEMPNLPLRQRRTPGSSSSIFTSRNVSTRTRCRNLAGRYMSHTHASSSSISK
jgi:hypothetical protein